MARLVSGNRGAALTSSAIARALAAKGLTDAQARAAIAGAGTLEAGLRATGLMPAGPAPAPIAVLLVIGDSNARGTASDEVAAIDPAAASVLTWANDAGAFVRYQPLVRTGCIVPGASSGSEKRVGPELGWINATLSARPGAALAIIKWARAGSFQTFLSGDDASNSWDATSGTLLSGAKAALTAAMARLSADGWAPTLSAIIDVTGTNDASSTRAGLAQAAKAAMYADLRAHAAFAPGATAFLTVRQYNPVIATDLATVRAAQAAVANGSADALLVDIDGTSANPGDGTHRDLAGQLAVGQRAFAARFDRINDKLVLPLQAKMRLLMRPATADTLAQDGSVAGTLTDQVGNRIMSQANVTYQPALATLAGRTALDFDGSNDELARSGSHGLGTGDAEGFLIVTSDRAAANATAGAIYQRGGLTDGTDLRIGRTVAGGVSRFRLRVGVGGSSAYQAVDTQVSAEGGPFVILWRMVGTTLSISVNGAPEQSASLVGAAAVADTTMTIGGRQLGQPFDGKVALIGECAVLTAGERAALLPLLMAEAGL